MSENKQSRKNISLAMQGGGAHGAFTWGVLDALLEDKRFALDAVSATSAGAVNGIALAYGMATGNAQKARETLHEMWYAISRKGALYSPLKRMPWENWSVPSVMENPLYMAFDMATRTLSPYQFNPMGLNPLENVLQEVIDFDALEISDKAFDLYVSATCVETGRVQVFHGREITDDVILASSALPFLYHAVEMDRKNFWDGGYVGNPPLFPLVEKNPQSDIVLVQINPVERKQAPRTAYDINNRMHEIAFNTSLDAELKHYATLQKIKREGGFSDDYVNNIPDCRFHMIDGNGLLTDLSVASKFSTDWDFICELRDKGRETTLQWIEKNYKRLGKDQTFDLEDEFL